MWAAEQDFLMLGTRFRIQATHAEHLEEPSRLLDPFDYGGRTGVRGRHTFSIAGGDLVGVREPGTAAVFRDCQRLHLGEGPDASLDALLATMNRLAVEECRDFAVHAGVVSIGGVGVAFPAESGDGKTTLTAACLLQGFAYASDEAMVVSADSNAIVRYPKPLALSQWSRNVLGMDTRESTEMGHAESYVTASQLGAELADPEFELGHIVLAEYGHGESSLEQAPAHEAMAALLRLSFNHYKDGERAFRLAARLATDAQVWRLRYGDPIQAAQLLRREISVA